MALRLPTSGSSRRWLVGFACVAEELLVRVPVNIPVPGSGWPLPGADVCKQEMAFGPGDSHEKCSSASLWFPKNISCSTAGMTTASNSSPLLLWIDMIRTPLSAASSSSVSAGALPEASISPIRPMTSLVISCYPPGGLVLGSERGNCRGAEEAQKPVSQLIKQDPVRQATDVALDRSVGMLEVCVPGDTDTEMLVFVLTVEELAAVEARVACGVPYPGQRLQVCDQQFGQGLDCEVLEFLVVAGRDSRVLEGLGQRRAVQLGLVAEQDGDLGRGSFRP